MAKVTASIDIDELVAKYLDRVAPKTKAAIEAKTEEIYQSARDKWPIKTGKSRDALAWKIILTNGWSITGRVACNVPYAYYIKSLNIPNSGSAFVELLRKPLYASVDPLADVLAQEIADSMRGR